MWVPALRNLLAEYLWAFLLQTVLYGVYLLMFGISVYSHLRRMGNCSSISAARNRRSMMIFSVILCAVVTAHWLLTCIRAFRMFVSDPEESTDTIMFLTDLGHPTWVALGALHELMRLLMDGLLVFRLSVFWKSRLGVIALPSATVIGDIVASTISCYYGVHFDRVGGPNWIKQTMWITISYCFSCTTNVVASSLIVWRVVSKNRALREFNLRTRPLPYMKVIVESASLYTFFNLLQLLLFAIKSPGSLASVIVAIPLNGIIYTVITLQLELGLVLRASDNSDNPRGRRPSLAPATFSPSLDPEAACTMVPLDVLMHAPAMASNPSLSAKAVGSSLGS